MSLFLLVNLLGWMGQGNLVFWYFRPWDFLKTVGTGYLDLDLGFTIMLTFCKVSQSSQSRSQRLQLFSKSFGPSYQTCFLQILFTSNLQTWDSLQDCHIHPPLMFSSSWPLQREQSRKYSYWWRCPGSGPRANHCWDLPWKLNTT